MDENIPKATNAAKTTSNNKNTAPDQPCAFKINKKIPEKTAVTAGKTKPLMTDSISIIRPLPIFSLLIWMNFSATRG